jgi:hypothetical protein
VAAEGEPGLHPRTASLCVFRPNLTRIAALNMDPEHGRAWARCVAHWRDPDAFEFETSATSRPKGSEACKEDLGTCLPEQVHAQEVLVAWREDIAARGIADSSAGSDETCRESRRYQNNRPM